MQLPPINSHESICKFWETLIHVDQLKRSHLVVNSWRNHYNANEPIMAAAGNVTLNATTKEYIFTIVAQMAFTFTVHVTD